MSNLSTDRAIESPDQDLLDRGRLAESLAAAISGWQGKDSLVLALQGSWGSGKTSVKNLTVTHLTDTVRVLEFNPWQWRGHDEISAAFFRELGVLLGQTDDQDARRAARWEGYTAYLNVGSAVARGARVVTSIAWVLAALLMGISLSSDAATRSIFAWATAIAVFIAGALTASEGVAAAIASLFRRKADSGTKALADRKSDVADSLASLEKPILVVIDDVDRLTPQETAKVFQLIKANADFPNLVYLVLFDQQVVAAALDQLAADRGAQFVEKIVQVAFQVPQPDRKQLQEVLLTRMQAILGQAASDERFSAERWWPLFEEGLRPFFSNLRDIYRFLAAFEFDIALVSKDGVLDVNAIDFIGIEALRVFQPDVYRALPPLKACIAPDLYDLRSKFHDYAAVRAQARTELDAVVEDVAAERREQVRLLLRELFPYYIADDKYQPQGSLEEWLRDLRVCHHRVFDRYFQYSIPSGDVSEREVNLVIVSGIDEAQRTETLESLADRGLLEVMLDHLRAREDEIPLASSVSLMTALFNVGERIDLKLHGPLGPRPLFDAESVVESLLARTESGQRGVHLGEAMRASRGLYLAANILHNEKNRRYDRQPGQDEPVLSEDQLNGARAVLAQRIGEAAEAGRLLTNPRLDYLLMVWIDISLDDARRWVRQVATSNNDLLVILNALLRRRPDMHSHAMIAFYDLDDLKSLFDLTYLEARAAELRGHRVSDAALDALDQALSQQQGATSDHRPDK